MNSDEKAVEAATIRFYDALNELSSGKGADAVAETWHHDDRVTSGHPSGEWALGWDEVWATWNVFAAFGREGRGESTIRDLKVRVSGDMAYTICVYTSPPAFGGVSLPCTDVLERKDGVWKLVHHHVDKSPEIEAAIEKLIREG